MHASYKHNWKNIKKTQRISSGVTYTSIRAQSEQLQEAVEICTIDLNDPHTDVYVASAQGGVARLETVRNLAQECLDRGKKVVAAINGDFFSPLGIPSGLQIVDGEIICSPQTNKVAMAIMGDRSVKLLHQIEMQAHLTLDTERILPLDAINRTRGLVHKNHLFLYNNRFGASTNTPEGGVEAVLKLNNPEQKLKPGHKIKATVEQIKAQGNCLIPQQGLVLSASGKKAKWLLDNLKSGTALEITVSYNQGVNSARQVISGNSTLAYALIKDGNIAPEVLDEQDPFHSDRHPRTMLATKAGKLHIVVIDGRQPGYSDGVTLAEGAYYLQSLGVEQAINIDGGGSSTYLFRPLGESSLVLANKPSDGFERAVGNALVITNTAPLGSPKQLILEPSQDLVVLKGSRLRFKVKCVDENLNPILIKPEELTWELSGSVGEISEQGELLVTSPQGSGLLKASLGEIETTVQLTCTDTIANLCLEVESTVLEPGSTASFIPHATDGNGQSIVVSPELLTWSIEGEIGTINNLGELLVSAEIQNGAVIAKVGSLVARREVQVGQEPLVLVDFESNKNLEVRSKNVVPGSVTFSPVSRPHPIRFGAFSGRLTYDFTGQANTSSVSIVLLNQEGNIGTEIPGRPYRFGIWVYGDGQGHWLRLVTRDAANNPRNLNFTPLGGLDWVGWRYVTAEVPANTAYPITVERIVLVEPNDANKNAGVVYFDNLRAEYVNLNEDVEGPSLDRFDPAPGSKIQGELTQISLRIMDHESGVDANSIRMKINGNVVPTQFDNEKGLLSYRPEQSFEEGEYQIQVQATDQAGNPSLPVDWSFRLITDEKLERRDDNAKQARW